MIVSTSKLLVLNYINNNYIQKDCVFFGAFGLRGFANSLLLVRLTGDAVLRSELLLEFRGSSRAVSVHYQCNVQLLRVRVRLN